MNDSLSNGKSGCPHIYLIKKKTKIIKARPFNLEESHTCQKNCLDCRLVLMEERSCQHPNAIRDVSCNPHHLTMTGTD